MKGKNGFSMPSTLIRSLSRAAVVFFFNGPVKMKKWLSENPSLQIGSKPNTYVSEVNCGFVTCVML